jgi:hypothetical protein
LTAADKQAFDALLAVATCRDSLCFADLCWLPFDSQAELQRLVEWRDPGVHFETAARMVVIEEHSGELRYSAGGWRSHESRIPLEQERIWAEGHEMGVFPSPGEAVLFAERFLAREQAIQEIDTPRLVHHRQETDQTCRSWKDQQWREPAASDDRAALGHFVYNAAWRPGI